MDINKLLTGMRSVKSKSFIPGIVLVLAICSVAAYAYYSSPHDGWVCQGGRWVAQGRPTSVKPSTSCTDGDKIGFEKLSKMTVAAANPELTAEEKTQWERIVKFIQDCGVKQIKQNHQREVTVTLKNTLEQSGKEPALDDIMKVEQGAEAKCGKVNATTE